MRTLTFFSFILLSIVVQNTQVTAAYGSVLKQLIHIEYDKGINEEALNVSISVENQLLKGTSEDIGETAMEVSPGASRFYWVESTKQGWENQKMIVRNIHPDKILCFKEFGKLAASIPFLIFYPSGSCKIN